MEKSVDFLTEYLEELEEMEKAKRPSETPLEGVDKLRLEYIIELANAKMSQYERIKDEEKWNRLEEVYYPILCIIAEQQGGKVKLEIDEDSFFAQLIYWGSDLTLVGDFGPMKNNVAALICHADSFYVSASDGIFKLQFLFNLYTEEKVEDHSEAIAEAQAKLDKLKTMH